MSREMKVTWKLPEIVSGFKEAKAKLEKELKKYDVVVTLDTLKDSKAMTTTLNKRAAEIDVQRKEAVYNVSEPIRAFEAEMKTLHKMCKDGREKILTQVNVFENETRTTIRKKLVDLLQAQYEHHEVDEEFKTASIDDLVILSNLTGKGSLTAKTVAEVTNRVNADKQVQFKVEMRLVYLENKCYKAGLTSPLTEVHISRFLRSPDDEYEAQLQSLIEVELERQKATEEAAVKKAATVAKAVVDHHTKAVEASTEFQKPACDSEQEMFPHENKSDENESKLTEAAPSGTIGYIVTTTFELAVPAHVPVEAIENKVRKTLDGAGFTTLKTIEVTKGKI